MKVDYEELFRAKLLSGINLFTGAGFSCLPDCDGNRLPIGNELSDEIKKYFNIADCDGMELEDISAILENNSSQIFQDYLRKRFHVEKYNPLYDSINKLNLKSYITTNIDNLIHCIMDNSSKYYLRSSVQYGASKNAPNEIQYVPLHGDITDIESHLYFGKFDLSMADQYNHNLFEIMYSITEKYPTLFWGYSFRDDGVKKVLAKILPDKRQDIWVVCREEGNMSTFFRSLGCHIIIASTDELLDWINKNIYEEVREDAQDGLPMCLKEFFVPSLNSVAIIPRKDYYLNSITNWYNVISKHAYDRKELSEIENLYISNKNIIIDGIPFSGKTSILMQLALKIEAPHKLFCHDLTVESSNYIIKNLSKVNECVIFVDECSDDILAYACLAKAHNIKTIATTDSFGFESSKHLMSDVEYKKIEIDELSKSEAQGIYNKIPENIREDVFTYKDNVDERFGMLEMMSKNVHGILSERKVQDILSKAYKKNIKVFDIIAVTAYLTSNKSLASLDIFLSYFEEPYDKVLEYISQAQELLADISLEKETSDSGYYVLRSHLFATKANDLLLNRFREPYAKVIKRFIKNTNSFRIYNHYIFRRSAYDATFFYKLFKNEAGDVYKSIYEYDESAYTLQQWALYYLKRGEYLKAFSKIDDAITLKPNNFSIQNTHAIILFEANKDIRSMEAIEEMNHAMSILADCYKSDRRKVYHAQKFAEYAMFLNSELNDSKYLETAMDWIDHIIDTEESKSRYTLLLRKNLSKLVNKTD